MIKKIRYILLSTFACSIPASTVVSLSHQANAIVNISSIFSNPQINKYLSYKTKPTVEDIYGYLHLYLKQNNKYTQYSTVLNDINITISDKITVTANPYSTKYTGSIQIEYGLIYSPVKISDIFNTFSVGNLYYVPTVNEVKKMLVNYLKANSKSEWCNFINYFDITISGEAKNLYVKLGTSKLPIPMITGEASFNYLLKTPPEFYSHNGNMLTSWSDEVRNNWSKYDNYSIMEIPKYMDGVEITQFCSETFYWFNEKNKTPPYQFTLCDLGNLTGLTHMPFAAFANLRGPNTIILPNATMTFNDWSFSSSGVNHIIVKGLTAAPKFSCPGKNAFANTPSNGIIESDGPYSSSDLLQFFKTNMTPTSVFANWTAK